MTCRQRHPLRHFNPLPPHGGRLPLLLSIVPRMRFQSTPSAWRETGICPQRLRRCHFNPLPPHGGRRDIVNGFVMPDIHFNPLPPHGGRPSSGIHDFVDKIFQSTPSAWRETYRKDGILTVEDVFQSTPSAWRETWRKLRG